MKKICFIDNNPQQTSKVVEALTGYYRDQTSEELVGIMVLVNIDQKNSEDTIKYFKEFFIKKNTKLEECKSIQEVEEHIRKLNKEDTVVMVDLHMAEGEEKKIDRDAGYKCISMQCMDELEKLGIKYVWYSSYAGNKFKDQWQKRYKMLYRREIPTIYEREELILAHFNETVAKEILEV
ncbi:MAG: hypothetical protein K2I22_12840 [Lachnospiraceae bacterium]|nr:hypothetical protein [Lachnospiraceae bacterium]